MDCRLCPIIVSKALEKVDGVTEVDIRYAKKQGLVRFDADRTNPEALLKAVEEAGYPAALREAAR